jgi:hypothetical protein
MPDPTFAARWSLAVLGQQLRAMQEDAWWFNEA